MRYILLFAISFALLSCGRHHPAAKPSAGYAVRHLSDYCASLKNTPCDTDVYVLDSGKNGASLLLAAGTHGNETAGILAAEFFAENARVIGGRVFVIPRLNMPGVASGSRRVPADYQGVPDPARYTPPGGSTQDDGREQRNVNRAYPGGNSGTAQKIALAVMNLLNGERIDIAIDMHEARPSSAVAWDIVTHPKNAEAAALAVLDLEEKGIYMRLDYSPPEMDGLSHKEWGDRAGAMAFLIETVNPGMADNHSEAGADDPRYAAERRTAIQLETVRALVSRCNETLPAPLEYALEFRN
jgi:predicted deacylase